MPKKAATKKAAPKKTTTKRATKKAVSKRAELKKEGNLVILYLDGNRRRAFRTEEDANRYIEKRHLND